MIKREIERFEVQSAIIKGEIIVVIITTYEPDINEWIDFKIRR